MSILEFKNVSKSFCKNGELIKVIDDISFNVEDGEIIAITGPSGCGKTTMFNIVSGLLNPSSGKVVTNGEIGYMFQRDHLFEYRTVYKNVVLGLEIKKKLTKDNLEEVDRMIETYGLKDFKNAHPSELSGGMRQRVALIRTLAVNPKLLLLDEPFAALDYQTKLIVSDDIYKIIKKEKKTTLMVTHDISEAIAMADKVIVLSKRPTKIKNIYNIKLTTENPKTPYEARKAVEFKDYFDRIWRDLNDE